MEHVITLIAIFAIFVPALLLPGPDFVAVVRASMTYGAGAGLGTTIGVSAGLGLYATLSLLGLSAILIEYQWLTWLVRSLGGVYLVILGIRLLWAGPHHIEPAAVTLPSPGRAVLFGFLVTLSNPKAIVLFASVFATAVTAATPGWLMGLIILLVVASSLAWYATVSVGMASALVMRRLEHGLHWIERAAGCCFIALGGKLVADARNPMAP